MAKKENKSNAASKNLIMVIVTGVILATATLCWFVANGGNKVDKIESPIASASSTAVFYCAEDSNRNGIIDGDEKYVEIETASILLNNMLPGAKYFYMVEFQNCPFKSSFELGFEDIIDNNTNASSQEEYFGDYVTVTSRITKVVGENTETNVKFQTEEVLSNKYRNTTDSQTGENIINATIIQHTGDENIQPGTYRIYYDFYLDKNVTTDKANYSLTINNVNATTVVI